jgi:hypothetical protein
MLQITLGIIVIRFALPMITQSPVFSFNLSNTITGVILIMTVAPVGFVLVLQTTTRVIGITAINGAGKPGRSGIQAPACCPANKPSASALFAKVKDRLF